MPKKPTIQQATEAMQIYWKLTGEKIRTPAHLEQVHKVLQDYLKSKQVVLPVIKPKVHA
jgi:hypothetical protein